ncbi:hypothetical protein HK100_006158 [Physocladia obscura]|uniref:NADH:flavin oxidoreductase/NADH oxidase N-terminal domain-containing protein n=1 Tax=Physocladia obscura TaxID=109957 RepID=A0AAD5SQT8_9FUNG|nr:hypothetical protein HK100_006158 [Physocladia obscura]
MQSLLDPLILGAIQLKHRIVMAPMTRGRATTLDEFGNANMPNKLMEEYYEQRATSGGLLITEATPICVESQYEKTVPGIYTPAQIDAWKRVTEKVHAKGGFIFLQIWHQGYKCEPENDVLRRAPPSASVIERDGEPISRELTHDEIREIVDLFGQAATNAIDAGFDGVEIKGGNEYIIDQFLNETTNKRTDRYGGSIENRNRFALEVVSTVIAAIGASRTGIRISPWEIVPDRTDVSQWTSLLRALVLYNLAYVHVLRATGGINNKPETDQILALRDAYAGGNLMLNRGYLIERANKTLDEGYADLISFGKLFLANPDLVDRVKLGKDLNTDYEFKTFYGGSSDGYTSYKTWNEQQDNLE